MTSRLTRALSVRAGVGVPHPCPELAPYSQRLGRNAALELEAIEAAAERPRARDLRAKGAHAARQIVV